MILLHRCLPRLLAQLMVESRVSQRALAKRAGVNRSTLRGVMAGQTPARVDHLEMLLQVLGHELDILPMKDTKLCPSVPPGFADAEKPLPSEPAVHVVPSRRLTANPARISPDRLPANAVTTLHGTRPGKAS
ncbi:helix-turn-helix domain-containing protein [Frigidibacter oleivorans]|uniref:helix-turn-helix domain-containing protein n=1 Tax=Frigidibacter oleivorans TaxID=2487129 RepID=UPI000F8EF13B|nr:helix-turn-helix transcriptional regulator [Frigidibacter oleivorans]